MKRPPILAAHFYRQSSLLCVGAFQDMAASVRRYDLGARE